MTDMTVIYGLYDHNCLRLADLVFLKEVRMEYFVCGCSSCERHYQILLDSNSDWHDLNYCIYCGVKMHE